MSEIQKLKEQLAQIKKSVERIEKELARLEKGSGNGSAKKPAVAEQDNEPGVVGTFDGFNMLTDSGEKFEVPSNYAAKSRLVYGDKLKMTETDGKKFFKQIEKIPRRKIEGIINKKEGKWYFLSHAGSYRISDTAAEYNSVRLNDEAIALIPENNINAPFATLDKVVTPASQPQPAQQKPNQPKLKNNNESNEPKSAAPANPAPQKGLPTESPEAEINLKTEDTKPQAPELPDNPRIIAEEDLR